MTAADLRARLYESSEQHSPAIDRTGDGVEQTRRGNWFAGGAPEIDADKCRHDDDPPE
jgi:hypothetical protein